MHLFLKEITDRIKGGGGITKPEARGLLNISREDLLYLFQAADSIRRFFKGDKIFICSIVNAKSGNCSEDCVFCSQSSRHRTSIDKYPLLSVEELLEKAEAAYNNNSRCVGLVTSGGALNDSEFSRILDAVKILKGKEKVVCASLGFLSKDRAAALKKAGVSRYNHNLETAPSHFPSICTTHNFEDRLKTISFLKSSGIEVCSGGIWGLGESPLERIELAFILRELEVDSLPVNILNPIPGTAIYGKYLLLMPLEILKTIAVYRLIVPQAELKICGGREVNLRSLQPLMFLAGANGFIAGNYLTTSGQEINKDYEMLEDLELGK